MVGDGVGAAGTARVRFGHDGQMSTAFPVTIWGDGALDLNGNYNTLGGPITIYGPTWLTGTGTRTWPAV